MDLVRGLDLKDGDQINLVADDGTMKIQRQPRPKEVLEGLRRLRGKMTAAERLSRDAAHERELRRHECCPLPA